MEVGDRVRVDGRMGKWEILSLNFGVATIQRRDEVICVPADSLHARPIPVSEKRVEGPSYFGQPTSIPAIRQPLPSPELGDNDTIFRNGIG